LNVEAENLDFEVPDFMKEEMEKSRGSGYYRSGGRRKYSSWRHELVKIKGKTKKVYRDLKTGRFIKKPTRAG
jgi:hypothetical protein